jgi:hypothetical protein
MHAIIAQGQSFISALMLYIPIEYFPFVVNKIFKFHYQLKDGNRWASL